jgi:hypothetical protein
MGSAAPRSDPNSTAMSSAPAGGAAEGGEEAEPPCISNNRSCCSLATQRAMDGERWRGTDRNATGGSVAIGTTSGHSRLQVPTKIKLMEGEAFNLFGGDPEELRQRLGELADQMQGAQRVAWADNAIRLAVEMTVAAINRLDLKGSSDEQAIQVRDAIRVVFPEAVTLVREAREGLS